MEKETALITGASAGIGRELAFQFAADKTNLVLVARREEKLNELARELKRTFAIQTEVVVQDLTEPDAPQHLFDRLSRQGTQVDVLVNNAGFGALSPLVTLPVHKTLGIVQLNILALTHLTRLFLPGMVERQSGGVLNVSSTASFQAGPNMAIYYATKAYVLHFSEALAEEVRGKGVKVSCLCPGPTITEFQAVAGMENSRIFRLGPMDARTVAQIGYRGFRKGKVIVIPGWRNWLGSIAVRFAPRKLVRRVVLKLNQVGPEFPVMNLASGEVDPRSAESS